MKLLYILKRIAITVPLLFGIVTFTFFIVQVAPGEPMLFTVDERSQRKVDPEIEERLRVRFGLDQPIYVQYQKWLSAVFTGDFGTSFSTRRPVLDMIAEAVPYTLQLTVLALFFDALIGISLGIFSAVRRNTFADRAITLVSLIVYSIPGFWLALMLVLVFSVNLGWLPTSQTRSLDYDLMTVSEKAWDVVSHMILPVFVLGIASAAGTARYMRSRLIEVLNEEYVLAARARGLRERTVVLKHAVRNALVPVITIYGLALPFLLGGSVLIENVFDWPGMGKMAVAAINARDYPVILATTTMAAVLTIFGNLLADIAYSLVDPRVAYDEGSTA